MKFNETNLPENPDFIAAFEIGFATCQDAYGDDGTSFRQTVVDVADILVNSGDIIHDTVITTALLGPIGAEMVAAEPEKYADRFDADTLAFIDELVNNPVSGEAEVQATSNEKKQILMAGMIANLDNFIMPAIEAGELQKQDWQAYDNTVMHLCRAAKGAAPKMDAMLAERTAKIDAILNPDATVKPLKPSKPKF